jgi:hypothetical protein
MAIAGDASNQTSPLSRDPLDALWRVLCSPLTARGLLIALALFVILGQALPQLPADVAGDPGELARWTAELSPFFREQVGWMQPAGLLNVYDTVGLRLIVGLLALALLISTADGILSVRRFLHGEDDEAMDPTESRGEWKLTETSLQDVAAGLRRDLLERRYLLSTQVEEKLIVLRAVRWPAYLLAHSGALVALFGLMLNVSFGWHTPSLALPPDQLQSVGRGDYTVKLEQGARTTTAGVENVELLSLFHAEELLTIGILSADRPLRYRNFSIVQQATGPLVHMRGETEDGAPLLLAPHPRTAEAGPSLDLAFAPGQTERYFRSAGGQVYRVEWHDLELRVDVYRPGETSPAWSQTLQDGHEVAFAGERVRFSSGHYVVLDVRSDPAWGMMLGGALLALTGIALAFYCPRTRLLWRIRPVRSTLRIECLSAGPGSDGEWLTLKPETGE